MKLDEAVSYAISFRVAASFEEVGSEVVCILLIILEENVKVDQNLLQLVSIQAHFFQSCFFHVCSWGRLVLRNKFYQIKLYR